MPFWFKRLHIITNQFQSWYFTFLVIVANGTKHFCLVQYSCPRTTIDHFKVHLYHIQNATGTSN